MSELVYKGGNSAGDYPSNQHGIVGRQGVGKGGDAYPTKRLAGAYPTLPPGKFHAGFVLKDDIEPMVRRQRFNWFEIEGKSPDEQVEKRKDTIQQRNEDEVVLETNDANAARVKKHERDDKEQEHSMLPMITMIPKLPGTNVVAMTLYGSQLRYTMGAIKNAEMIQSNFPGWTLRIYTETPSEHSHYGLVPQTVLSRLQALGAEVHFIDVGEDWVPPMMWRFLVADDTWVDRFIVRDCDSRLIERDAAAVYDWVKSGKAFHCIRDHPSHASYAVSGGMWGGKPAALRDILRRSWREMMRGVRKDYLEDMNFLNHIIWPKVQAYAFCSDSVSCDKYPSSFPFPIPRYGYEHVGEVYNEHDLGRPIDIDILRHAGENPVCKPGQNVTFVADEKEENDKGIS